MSNCSRRYSSLERSSRDGKIQRPLLDHRRPVPVRRRQRRRNDGSSSLWTDGRSGCNTTLIKDRSGRHANLRYPGRNPVQQGDERFPHLGNACLLGRHPKAGGLADVSTSRENGIASSQDGEPGETKMSRTHPSEGERRYAPSLGDRSEIAQGSAWPHPPSHRSASHQINLKDSPSPEKARCRRCDNRVSRKLSISTEEFQIRRRTHKILDYKTRTTPKGRWGHEY